MARNNVAWLLWIGGIVLIVASWVRVVPAGVGWAGCFIALFGSAFSRSGQSRRPPSDRPPVTDNLGTLLLHGFAQLMTQALRLGTACLACLPGAAL